MPQPLIRASVAPQSTLDGKGEKSSIVVSAGRGGSGVVAGLSNKLTRQRTQLDELISQSTARKSTWRWYHVVVLLVLNNAVLLGIGITAGSALYSLGPVAGGSYHSGRILSEAMTVAVDGAQTIIVESTYAGSSLSIRGAGGRRSRLVLCGHTNQCSHTMGIQTHRFDIRQAGTEPAIVTFAGSDKSAHIALAGGGEVRLDDGLGLGWASLCTRNSSLYINSGNSQDILVVSGGETQVKSGVKLAGTLRAAAKHQMPLLVADPVERVISVGTTQKTAALSITGDVFFSDRVRVLSGGINVHSGDVDFGASAVHTAGSVTIGGSVLIGDMRSESAADVYVRGVIAVQEHLGTAAVTMQPTSGSAETAGQVTVGHDAELRGDVVLGGQPTDTVKFFSYAAQLNNLVTLGSVILGDGGDDSTSTYGSLRVRDSANKVVFDVDPHTGNLLSQGSLTVAGVTSFAGSLGLGDGSLGTTRVFDDVIEIRGRACLSGNISVTGALTVQIAADARDILFHQMTATGKLLLRDHARRPAVMVDPFRESIYSLGSLVIGEQDHGDYLASSLMQNVELGSGPDDTTVVGQGPRLVTTDALMKAALIVEMEAMWQDHVVVHANLQCQGDVEIHKQIRGVRMPGFPVSIGVARSSFLGAGSENHWVGRGHLQFQGNVHAMPSVALHPSTGDLHTQGNISIKGTGLFHNLVSVHAHLHVHTEVFLLSKLGTHGVAAIGASLRCRRRGTLDGGLTVRRLQVHGNTLFGSSDSTEIATRNRLTLKNDQGVTFRANPHSGDTSIVGFVHVDGDITMASDTNIGESYSSVAMLYARTRVKQQATAEGSFYAWDKFAVHGVVLVDAAIAVHASATLGDEQSDVIGVHNFGVVDGSGDAVFAISSSEQRSLGSAQISCNLDVGFLTVPRFATPHEVLDRITKRTAIAGVTIGSVQLKDGGVGSMLSHELHELVAEAGVTVGHVVLQDGCVTLQGTTPGEVPSRYKGVQADLVVLMNAGNKGAIAANLRWNQTYFPDINRSQGADSSMLGRMTGPNESQGSLVGSMVPTNDASASSALVHAGTTHMLNVLSNASQTFLTFQTAHRGRLGVRLKVAATELDLHRIVLHSSTGAAQLPGGLLVGNVTGPREVAIESCDNGTAVFVRASHSGSAKVSLVSRSELETEFSVAVMDMGGTGALNFVACSPRASTREPCGTTVAFNASGHVACGGNMSTGGWNSSTDTQIVIASNSGAAVYAEAGGDYSAAVIVASSKGRRARLGLGDSGPENSSFNVYNDGATKHLRVGTDQRHDLVSIFDDGTLGNVRVSGDAQLGRATTPGLRQITVQSGKRSAYLDVVAGGNSGASVLLVSGRNKRSTLILEDLSRAAQEVAQPWADGTINHRTDFKIISDGQSSNYAALSVSGSKGSHSASDALMSILDHSDVGNISVSGNGVFGSEYAAHPQSLEVRSLAKATVNVASSDSSSTWMVVTSSAQHKSMLTLADAGMLASQRSRMASLFSVINDGHRTLPIPLRATWQRNTLTSSPPVLRITTTSDLLRVVDEGKTGDMTLAGSGNATFGGPSASASRHLAVHTSGHASIQLASSDQLDLTKTPAQCSDASLTIRANARRDSKVLLIDPAPGNLGSQFQVQNKGSLTNFTLQIDNFLGRALIELAARTRVAGSIPSGQITATGSATFGSEVTAQNRALSVGPDQQACSVNDLPFCKCQANEPVCPVQWTSEAKVMIDSGASYDAFVHARAGSDRSAKLVLTDAPLYLPALSHFEVIQAQAANAEPFLSVTDGVNTIMQFVDRGSTGDIRVTGDGMYGLGLCTAAGDARSRTSCELTGNVFTAAVTVPAACSNGISSTRLSCVTTGGIWTPELRVGPSCTNGGNVGSEHACERTGNLYVPPVGPRALLVQSAMGASVDLLSGSSDAQATVVSGGGMNATVTLGYILPGTEIRALKISSRFNSSGRVHNNATVLAIADSNQQTLATITDRDSIGDFFVDGSARFGGAAAFGARRANVQSARIASVSVVPGTVDNGTAIVTAGAHCNAKLTLHDPAIGLAASKFEIFVDGGNSVSHALRMIDNNGHTMVTLQQQSANALLLVSGDALIGGSGDSSVAVRADAAALLKTVAGTFSHTVVAITAGVNKDASLVFTDTAAGVDGAQFNVVNRGAENAAAMLDVTDGVHTLLKCVDAGITGDLVITGEFKCSTAASSGRVNIGINLANKVDVMGHVSQPHIVFDASTDGSGLTLQPIDPSVAHTIIFPQLSASILTSTSSRSGLQSVRQLGLGCNSRSVSCGSIANGFGSVVTTGDIETVGSGAINAGAKFTASANTNSHGRSTLGSSETDIVVCRGTLATSHMRLGFHSTLTMQNLEVTPNTKKSRVAAAFSPTSGLSPPGERGLKVPDIPMRGNLHVVTKRLGQLSNVGHITMDTTAGVIESNSDLLLGSHQEESFFLSNQLIQASTSTHPGSVLLASISDFGSGGIIAIRASKVGQIDGSATIVCRNIASTPMTSTYKISFAVLN